MLDTPMDSPSQDCPAHPIENPVWTFGDFLLVTLAFGGFLAIAILVAVGITVASGHAADMQTSVIIAIFAQTLAYLGTMLVISRAIRHRATALHRYLDFFGALRWNMPRQPWLFAATGMAVAAIVIATEKFLPIPQHVPFEDAFKTAASAYVTAAFGIAVAPLCEEIYFRGLMYPVLVRAFRITGTTGAVALSVTVTAALFALLHADQLAFSWAPLLIIFIVGVILTVVRAQTRSLAASWLLHASYNTTLLAVMFVQTGAFRHLN